MGKRCLTTRRTSWRAATSSACTAIQVDRTRPAGAPDDRHWGRRWMPVKRRFSCDRRTLAGALCWVARSRSCRSRRSSTPAHKKIESDEYRADGLLPRHRSIRHLQPGTTGEVIYPRASIPRLRGCSRAWLPAMRTRTSSFLRCGLECPFRSRCSVRRSRPDCAMRTLRGISSRTGTTK